jgi:hypothetical protein
MSSERGSLPDEHVKIEDLDPPTNHHVFAEYLEHDKRPSANGVWTKVVRWDRLWVGNCCEEPGATLTLASDGAATFECVTFTNSTHSGDYWWAAFQLQDKDKVTLHSERYHKGPRMDDGEGHAPPRYRWSFNFSFDASKFEQIAGVLYSYRG